MLRIRVPRVAPPPQANTQVYLRVGGVWKLVTVWERVGGVWKTTTDYIKISGTWK
jgi:hypothetical protein